MKKVEGAGRCPSPSSEPAAVSVLPARPRGLRGRLRAAPPARGRAGPGQRPPAGSESPGSGAGSGRSCPDPSMATEIVYADLDPGAGERCGKRRSLPEPGSPGCPRWHRVALGAGWTGTLLLGVAVVALGCSFPQRQPESPGSGKIGNGNIGDINSTRENELLELREVLRKLREVLCPSQSQGAEGCRICPQGWTPGRTKCYWTSTEYNPWKQSREDCEGRGATLLLLRDRDELEFLNETLQKPGRNFWIGLSEVEKVWTWVNGSRLDRHRFQLEPGERPGKCGGIKGSRIISQECDSEAQWICQREATEV